MAEKVDKKELREPDALQRAGLEARGWIEGKEKLVLGVILVALLAGLAVALTNYMQERSARTAQRALGGALLPVNRPVAEAGVPPSPTADPNLQPFASQKEKDEAIVSSLTTFRSEYPGTPSATTAALPLAQSHYRLGNYDQAIEAYGAFLKNAPGDDPLRALALEGQGYAYEAKGDLEKAVASFDELSRAKTKDFLDGMGQFHKARILILQDKKDEAAKILSEIPQAHPNSAAARMATERMNVLASQGVNVPTPAPTTAVVGTDAGTGS